jgi:hypothetical protein
MHLFQPRQETRTRVYLQILEAARPFRLLLIQDHVPRHALYSTLKQAVALRQTFSKHLHFSK